MNKIEECMDLQNKAIASQLDEVIELAHRRHSVIFLVYIVLIVLSTITIWTFKHRRFRFIHETGLSVIYGLIVGIALRYGIKPSKPTYEMCPLSTNTTSCGGQLPPEKVLVQLPMGVGNKKLTLSYAIESVFEPSANTEISFSHIATFDPEIFLNVLLPPIIFTAGYSMKRGHFFKNIWAILTYAFCGTLISSLCVGVICYLCTRISSLSSSLLFSDCLFFGAVISATDPITVLAIFNDMSVDVDLYALVFGESVLNDALAIALSQSVEKYGSKTSGNFDAGALFAAIGDFLAMFGGSFAIGIGVGLITALMTKFTHIREYPLLESVLFILMSYSTFLLAETVGFTGIVAVLFCGITQAHYTYNNLSEQSKTFTKQVFELLNFLSENFLFAYLGVSTFTFQHHYWHVGFVFISLFACLVARAVSIYPLSALINLCRGHRPICFCCPSKQTSSSSSGTSSAVRRDPDVVIATGNYQAFQNPSQSESLDQTGSRSPGYRSNRITWNMQHMLLFSGLRGAMAFSLAIRNTASETRQMFFSTTIVIVMVTVLLCGGLATSMLKWLHIPVGDSTTETNATPSQSDAIGHQYNQSFVNRHWLRFDKNYLKPLLTHSRPLLTETLPWCCFGLAKLLTSEEQRLAILEENVNDSGRRQKEGKLYDLENHHALCFASGNPNLMDDGTYKPSEMTDDAGMAPLPSVSLSVGKYTHPQEVLP